MNTGIFASKYDFGISNSRYEASRCHIATCSKLRVHSHVSLFSRKVWASKVMYRGSAVNALVVLGIPPQKMPQKRSRHMQTTVFGLVARRRLSSSEGAPEGVGEVS